MEAVFRRVREIGVIQDRAGEVFQGVRMCLIVERVVGAPRAIRSFVDGEGGLLAVLDESHGFGLRVPRRRSTSFSEHMQRAFRAYNLAAKSYPADGCGRRRRVVPRAIDLATDIKPGE